MSIKQFLLIVAASALGFLAVAGILGAIAYYIIQR